MTQPNISVIVPCRNEVKHIGAFLDSVLAQTNPDGGFEVIIADGMSDDGTRKILDHYHRLDKRIRMIDNPELTTPFALNHAIRAARGDILVRLDVHSVFPRDYIRESVYVLIETGADAVGGPVIARGTNYLSNAVAIGYQSPLVIGGSRHHDTEYEGKIDTVFGGCWHKELFDEVGLFDEELTRNQDDEFNLRLNRNGKTVYQSLRLKSYYYPRNSLVKLFKQYRQYGYYKIRVIQKHKLPASIRHLVPGTFVGSSLFFTCSLLVTRLLSAIKKTGPWHNLYKFNKLILAAEWLAYACFVLYGSFSESRKHGWRYLPILPVIFATFQVSYGLGFLEGVKDFIVLRKKRPQMQKMTR